ETAEPAPAVGTTAAALEPPGSEGERLEHALAVETSDRPGAEAFEAAEARLALGIDLTAVEGLSLLGVADDLVGGVDLGEAGCRLGVVLVGVRVVLLGELAERALDVRRARALGHAQDLIGVAHPQSLRKYSSRYSGIVPTMAKCGEPRGRAQRLGSATRLAPILLDCRPLNRLAAARDLTAREKTPCLPRSTTSPSTAPTGR